MKVQAGLVLMSLVAMCSSKPDIITGGITVIYPPLNDPIVTRAFNYIVEYYRNRGDYRVRKAAAVEYATSQIVKGVKYVITLKILRLDNGEVESCTVPYVDQSWTTPRYYLAGEITCGFFKS